MRHHITAAIAVTTLVTLAGCSKEPDHHPATTAAPAETAPAAPTSTPPAASHDDHDGHAHAAAPSTDSAWKAERDSAYTALTSALEPITGRWGDLQELADQLGGSLTGDQQKMIDDIKAQYNDVTAQLANLKVASKDAWSDLRSAIEQSTGDLREAIDNAMSQIRSAAPDLPSLPGGLGG